VAHRISLNNFASFLSTNQEVLSFLDTAIRTAVTKPIEGNQSAIAELATILSNFHTQRISTTVARFTLRPFYAQYATDDASIENAIDAFVGWMESLSPLNTLVVPSSTQATSPRQLQAWVNNQRSLSDTSGSAGVGDAAPGLGAANSETTPSNRRDQNVFVGALRGAPTTHPPGGGLDNVSFDSLHNQREPSKGDASRIHESVDPSSSDDPAPDEGNVPLLPDALAHAREHIMQSTLDTSRVTTTSDQRGESTWFSCFPNRLPNANGDEREDNDRSCTCTIQ
jgi:hypothetical protein